MREIYAEPAILLVQSMTQSKLPPRCLICSFAPEPGTDYCAAHVEVIKHLKEAYSSWQVAYGKISVSNFLLRILKRPETGDVAKQAAGFLVQNPGKWD